jgi:phosphoglycolate phosphatase
MKFQDKKLIIFDLDGTLIDSVPDLAFAINSMLKSLDRDTFEVDTIRHWVGNGAKILVSRALSASSNIDSSLDEKFIESALDIFLKAYSKNLSVSTIIYPNVKDTLLALKSKGYKLAIVTNKPYDFVPTLLETLKLDNLFELILGGDSLKEKKPSPMPLLYVCDKLDISVKDAVMVGDSKNDIVSASSANMDSIGVSYGYNYGESIEVYNPKIVVDDFGEILKFML